MAAYTTNLYWGVSNGILEISNTPTTIATTLNTSIWDCTDGMTPWLEYMYKITTVNVVGNVVPKNIVRWFGLLPRATSFNLSGLDTSGVNNMGSLFFGCELVTSLNLSNFNTTNVTNLSYCFYNCNKLKTLNLSTFNTSNCTEFNEMFQNCWELESINLGNNFDMSNSISNIYMFAECYALTTIDLSKTNIKRLYAYNNRLFENCSSLRTIYCDANLWSTFNNDNLFIGCTNLVGAISYDPNKTSSLYANPVTGYFTSTKTFPEIYFDGTRISNIICRNTGSEGIIDHLYFNGTQIY